MLESRGERALPVILEHNVELIITEVMLPDMCGFEICRRIRTHPQIYALPVLLISSMCAEDEVQHGFAQGADEYLIKPCDAQILLGRVSEQLRNAASSSQLDPITKLANPKMLKISIQRHINTKTRFAIVYIELMSLNAFTHTMGEEARKKALKHLAWLLKRYGKRLNSDIFYAAHAGSGHFVCITAPEHAEIFSESVLQGWHKHLPELYEAVGFNPNAKNVSQSSFPLSLMVCVTDSTASGARTAQEFFDVLAHLRKKSISSGDGGICFDHRKSL